MSLATPVRTANVVKLRYWYSDTACSLHGNARRPGLIFAEDPPSCSRCVHTISSFMAWLTGRQVRAGGKGHRCH